MNGAPFVEKHCDVSEEEGWITIPHGKVPNAWKTLQISGHCSPGTVLSFFQVNRYICWLACRPVNKMDNAVENGEASYEGQTSPQKDISDGDALWSRRITRQLSSNPSRADAQNLVTMSNSTDKHLIGKSGTMYQGNFDANATGGMARNFINCFSLTNGDIVREFPGMTNCGPLPISFDLIWIDDDFLQDPFIEIRQFERRSMDSFSDQKDDNLLNACNEPCGELLTWLFPLGNTLPAARSPSPAPLSSSGIGSTSQRSNFSSSPSSQIFSFGNFRSYSMSSLPQSTAQATAPVTTPSSKSNFDLEDQDRYSGKKLSKSQIAGKEGLLSFRGVLLEPERFSVCCGLEGGGEN